MLSKEEVKEFLSIDRGIGYGFCSGFGSFYGSGHSYESDFDINSDGEGYGFGVSYGCGLDSCEGPGYYNGKEARSSLYCALFTSFGSISGYGFGPFYDDIGMFNGKEVHLIDCIPTIIESIHGNYAKGYILHSDLTLKPCYVAKVDNCFAHGETMHNAFEDAVAKAIQEKSVKERIEEFLKEYPDNDKKIPAKELYKWHGILTCSCRFGRNRFIKEHGIDVENDSFTIKEFIELTKNEYGSDIIERLEKYVKERY